MKITKKIMIAVGLIGGLLAPLTISPLAFAATSPGLGAANTFVVLSDTYTNTVPGTVLNGDVGFTTAPDVSPTINGATQHANGIYNQAGIDQNNALIALDNQPCTFNFPPGPIDLASDTTHGPVGVYTPGVYCITGAASIAGGDTITLSGQGTFIFRIDGALTTSANSSVVLEDSASACDVWWTPTQASTLGANSLFSGTNIDASGITIGNTVTWVGQALAFGGTVTTDTDTISAPVCSEDRALPAVPITSGNTPGLPDTGDAEESFGSYLSVLIVSMVAVALAGVSLSYKKAN